MPDDTRILARWLDEINGHKDAVLYHEHQILKKQLAMQEFFSLKLRMAEDSPKELGKSIYALVREVVDGLSAGEYTSFQIKEECLSRFPEQRDMLDRNFSQTLYRLTHQRLLVRLGRSRYRKS